MNRSLFVAISVLFLLGCKTSQKAAQPTPLQQPPRPAESIFTPRPAPTGPTSTLIQAGKAPLATIFEQGGNIRIVDADSGAALVKLTLAPRTIIAVSKDAGILIGGEKVLPGPLADHRYEIWFDSGAAPSR